MTIVLHIGFPKTGSSALQYGFEKNREILAANGIHYGQGHVSALTSRGGITSGNGARLAQYLVPRRRTPDFDEAAFAERFASRYVSADHPISLISSEALAFAEPAMLARFASQVVRNDDVVVVAIIRDIYGHARSAWMQGIKRAASSRDFDAFSIESYAAHQVDLLRAYVAALGRERIRLLHYETEKHDLLAAMLRVLGVDAVVDTSLPAINRSLSSAEIEVLRACNAAHRDPAISRLLSDMLIEKYPDRSSHAEVDPEIVARFEARYGDDVAWVNDTFFAGRPTLRVAAPPREPSAAPAAVAAEAIWLDVVAALAGRVRELETPRRPKAAAKAGKAQKSADAAAAVDEAAPGGKGPGDKGPGDKGPKSKPSRSKPSSGKAAGARPAKTALHKTALQKLPPWLRKGLRKIGIRSAKKTAG